MGRLDSAYLLKSYGFQSMIVYGIALATLYFVRTRTLILDSWLRRVFAYGLIGYLVLVFAPLHTEPFIYFPF